MNEDDKFEIPPDLAKIFGKLQAGEITLEEYQKKMYKRQQKIFTPQLLEYRAAGKWNEFCGFVIGKYEIMPIAFKYFEEIPDELKYQFLINCYQHHGDELPIVRKYVKQMRKWGEPAFPHYCGVLDTLTIYRAGAEDINKAKKSISWTLNINIARFFQERNNNYEKRCLYKGYIKKDDVLAYNDEREEQEIMQYNKVFGIEIVDK